MEQKRTEADIIKDAAQAFNNRKQIADDLAKIDQQIQKLCTEYGSSMKVWGFAPHHLKNAIRIRLGEEALL